MTRVVGGSGDTGRAQVFIGGTRKVWAVVLVFFAIAAGCFYYVTKDGGTLLAVPDTEEVRNFYFLGFMFAGFSAVYLLMCLFEKGLSLEVDDKSVRFNILFKTYRWNLADMEDLYLGPGDKVPGWLGRIGFLTLLLSRMPWMSSSLRFRYSGPKTSGHFKPDKEGYITVPIGFFDKPREIAQAIVKKLPTGQ